MGSMAIIHKVRHTTDTPRFHERPNGAGLGFAVNHSDRYTLVNSHFVTSHEIHKRSKRTRKRIHAAYTRSTRNMSTGNQNNQNNLNNVFNALFVDENAHIESPPTPMKMVPPRNPPRVKEAWKEEKANNTAQLRVRNLTEVLALERQ